MSNKWKEKGSADGFIESFLPGGRKVWVENKETGDWRKVWVDSSQDVGQAIENGQFIDEEEPEDEREAQEENERLREEEREAEQREREREKRDQLEVEERERHREAERQSSQERSRSSSDRERSASSYSGGYSGGSSFSYGSDGVLGSLIGGLVLLVFGYMVYQVSNQSETNDNDAKNKDTQLVSRFLKNEDGTVTDRETGLMWAAKDNGRGINYPSAVQYVKKYKIGCYDDWRMPSNAELALLRSYGIERNLYDKNNYNPQQPISISGDDVWSSDKTEKECSSYYSFNPSGYGGDYCISQDFQYRVLPVRNSVGFNNNCGDTKYLVGSDSQKQNQTKIKNKKIQNKSLKTVEPQPQIHEIQDTTNVTTNESENKKLTPEEKKKKEKMIMKALNTRQPF